MSDLPDPTPAVADQCPLSWSQQRRNLVLFALSIGMQYLAAPVLYIGITQASLCEKLNAPTSVSNLPATLFFAMTAMPALIAWLSPQVSVLKRNLTICYSICAAMLGSLAVVLALDLSNSVKIAMVILQGGVSGAVMPAATAYLWEAVSRGSDESRRGLALGLAFGAGPILAVIGSACQTGLLGGPFFGWNFEGRGYPNGYIVLFAAGVPMMGLAILFGQMLVIPPPERELHREPVSEVVGLLIGLPAMLAAVFFLYQAGLPAPEEISAEAHAAAVSPLRFAGYALGGVATLAFVWHFRSILRQRTLLVATIVTILVYCGNMIPSNMNLYSPEVLGDEPSKYAGLQNTLRFGFKVVAGTLLGWMLTRTSPRAGILATSAIFLAAQVWAFFATGTWYLVAFGIFGAGELVGVYAPNYIVSASRSDDLRRNTAFMTMLMAPAAPAGYLYGAIVDFVKSNPSFVEFLKSSGVVSSGATPAAVGFRLSFLVCGLLIAGGIAVAITLLPKHPRAAVSGSPHD